MPEYRKCIIYFLLLLLSILNSYSISRGEESLGSLDMFGIDWKVTIDSLKEAIEKNPDDINLKFVLGNLYLKNIMLDEAESEFRKIIKIQENHSLSYIFLGNIYMLRANTKRALEFYGKAIHYDKKNLKAYNLMNIVLMMERRFKDAIEILEDAKRNYPNDVSIFYNLTLNYLSINDTDNAIINAQKAIELDNSSSNFLILGVAYVQKKEFKKAIDTFNKTLLLSPEDKKALIALAGVFYEDNQYQEAINTMRKAEKLYPRDEEIKEALNDLLSKKPSEGSKVLK